MIIMILSIATFKEAEHSRFLTWQACRYKERQIDQCTLTNDKLFSTKRLDPSNKDWYQYMTIKAWFFIKKEVLSVQTTEFGLM